MPMKSIIKRLPFARFAQQFFTQEKFTDSIVFNYFGAQLVRYLLAKLVYQFRTRAVDAGKLSKPHIDTLISDGIVVIPDAFSDDIFRQLKGEFESVGMSGLFGDAESSADEDINVLNDGSTQRIRKKVRATNANEFPQTVNLLTCDWLLDILEGACGKKLDLRSIAYEQIRHGESISKPDPAKDMHSDTFYEAFKFWIFLEDVDLADGPFTFVPRSHRLSFQRMLFEYQETTSNFWHTRNGKWTFRPKGAYKEQLAQNEIPLVAKANTLVIANVGGMHHRGEAELNTGRKQIFCSIRFNPFDLQPNKALHVG